MKLELFFSKFYTDIWQIVVQTTSLGANTEKYKSMSPNECYLKFSSHIPAIPWTFVALL